MSKPSRDVILILSGGGVRGLAHAGVYTVLCERGYSVKYVIGTSAGALVGGMIAAGYESKELSHTLMEMNFADFSSKWNIVRIFKAIFSDGCIDEDLLAIWYEEKMCRKFSVKNNHKVDFKDLKTPFVAVATNLTTHSPVIYSQITTPEQSVTQAVIASSSFPFFFQAKRELANSVTDGGLVANLPVSVLLNEQVLQHVKSLQLSQPLVVAVRLKDSVESWGPFGKTKFGKELVSAAMLSNAELQVLLLKLLSWQSCVIEVDVSSVSALDLSVDRKAKENIYNNGKLEALDALPVIPDECPSDSTILLRNNIFIESNKNDNVNSEDLIIVRIVDDFLKTRAGNVSALNVISEVVAKKMGIQDGTAFNKLRDQVAKGNLQEFQDGYGVSGKGKDLLESKRRW